MCWLQVQRGLLQRLQLEVQQGMLLLLAPCMERLCCSWRRAMPISSG